MKRLFIFQFVFALVLGFSFHSQAGLINRGIDSNGNRLIYDSDFNITWYDYTPIATSWPSQLDWVSGLTVNFEGTIFDDWRLPKVPVVDHTCSNTVGGKSYGMHCTGNEMGHLFYTELGNVGNGPSTNNSPFIKFKNGDYWLPLDNAPFYAYFFEWDRGNLSATYIYQERYVLAVRDGDVTAIVPEPVSSILFLTGGATLIGRKYIRRKKIEV